ncbi:Cyclopropane fatty-acyl-phospholipid synthase [Daejeonella rubra]|uniref:Cyclopropane fatty-acyl-phospholipid synthase n=1 Tax=Daejeonella rubra TaxID=990371 RepID=A0A1G9WJL6_9SPHI|nr:class I SAM-dependent methyltransferase [Daejeonella rubra]SDM84680.1 Cyclopropane fatty-acyl-phospholipid synthase [Daejeonella rubra]
MENQLTDRKFWTNYWESKPDLAISIDKNYLFHQQLELIIKKNNIQTAIELGGFPGYYSIFLRKYLGVKTTLFDYFIHPDILKKVLTKNGLNKDDITVIESDLFQYKPIEKYDLVLSCGLIEHFKDTKDIIERHLEFLKPEGTLFITLPNFRGVNGWVQKTFDRDNYLKHNIDCMDPEFLKKTMEDIGLEVVRASYLGKYSVWLENKDQKSSLTKAFIKSIWFIGKVATTIIPFESKVLSPYIILEAKKKL